MKVNRIKFDAYKLEYEISKMRAAYVAAEQLIVSEAAKGNDLTGANTHGLNVGNTIAFEPMDAEQFHWEVDAFGNIKNFDLAEDILNKAREVRKKLDDAIQNDDYVKARAFQNILDGLEIEYNKLKGNE